MAQSKNHSRRHFIGGLAAVAGVGALAVSSQSSAESMMGPTKNKVVFQLNKSDAAYVLDILHSAAVVLGHYNSDADIVIDCFGPGLWLLVKAPKNHQHYEKFIMEQVESLHMYGVVFNACEQTMKTIHIDKADLIPQATPVFSGAVDLITLQQKGYAYIAW
ncbi:MAG: DsrE family protein [Acidithiobacillus sp.]|jgi:intracellular sulfur oxidation DsrE/DsrF family protein